jgi:hypothetical protein
MRTCSAVNSPRPGPHDNALNYSVSGFPGVSDDEVNGPDHREISDIDSDADHDPVYYVCVEMQYHDHLVQLQKAHE